VCPPSIQHATAIATRDGSFRDTAVAVIAVVAEGVSVSSAGWAVGGGAGIGGWSPAVHGVLCVWCIGQR
jgi:hypothetical protein